MTKFINIIQTPKETKKIHAEREKINSYEHKTPRKNSNIDQNESHATETKAKP